MRRLRPPKPRHAARPAARRRPRSTPRNSSPLPVGARYVALGSSYAAGPGIRPRAVGAPRAAGRSAVNYAHLVASDLALDLVDATYSGATTVDILGHGRQPSQVDQLTQETRLVTLTGGGNDVGYIPLLFAALLPAWVPGFRAQKRAVDHPEELDQKLVTVRASLADVAAEVHRRAPQATVVFVNYLTVLPPDSSLFETPRSKALADLGRSVADRLAEATAAAARENGCVLVDVATASASHHAWSDDPWTTRLKWGSGLPAPLHPNAAGMRAAADAVLAALQR